MSIISFLKQFLSEIYRYIQERYVQSHSINSNYGNINHIERSLFIFSSNIPISSSYVTIFEWLIVLVLLFVVSSLFLGFAFRGENHNAIYKAHERVEERGSWWFPKFLLPTPVHEIVARGYEEVIKVTGRPFVVNWWARNYLIMPPKYLSDLKRASSRQLSFFTNISDALYLHTTVGDLYQSDRMVRVVKKGMNPQLPHLTTQVLPNHVDNALAKEIGRPDAWKSLPITKTMIAISHRASTPVMISEEAAQGEDFVQASMRFVQSIFENALVIVALPLGPLREYLAYPLSYLHQKKLFKAARLLQPIVEKRKREFIDSTYVDKYDDGIKWTLACSDGDDDTSTQLVTVELLHGLWAGTSAPGGLVANMIIQCLMEPFYTEALRSEAQAMLGDGDWTDAAFGNLRLQDSFIREVNRVYPTGSVTCSRTVKDQPFQFSDGLTLPVNTRFGFPIMAMQNDPLTFDNPLNFDGSRFMHMEEAGGTAQRWAASSIDKINLAFGYGNHACPGRFYAIRKAKLIFTKLLLEYDFQWDGEMRSRPAPLFVEGQFVPNMNCRALFRRR